VHAAPAERGGLALAPRWRKCKLPAQTHFDADFHDLAVAAVGFCAVICKATGW